MTPYISIIICTRNRAESLRETLKHITSAEVPPNWNVELLLVDNGSTDHTASVFQSVTHFKFSLRYIREEQLGKSFAYNRGLSESKGDVLIWTDDDVRVPKNWIAEMSRPILEGHTDAVAGAVAFPPHIERIFSTEPFASHRGWYAATNYLNTDNPQSMVGANMAFHRRILSKVPFFDVKLGPGALGFCDESLFSQQLKEAGFRLKSNFNCIVEHHFDIQRATPNGLIQAARSMGRSYAFVYYHWEHMHYPLVLPRLLFALVRLNALRLLSRARHLDPNKITARQLRLEQAVAFCREYMAESGSERKYRLRGLVPLTQRQIQSNKIK